VRQPLVLFLHIPKTGGTTLENMLCAESPGRVLCYEPGFCLREPGLQSEMDAIAARATGEIRAVSGHFSYGLHHGVSRPCRYLTLLRDPVDRVISLYAHFFRWGDDRHGVRRRRLTLAEFVTGTDCPDVENGQTRRLAGQVPGDEMLDVALSRLHDGTVLAGLTDRHRASLVLFSRRLGWTADIPAPALVNAQRPARETLPPAVVAQIAERNALDYELLAHARSLFTQQVSAPATPGTARLSPRSSHRTAVAAWVRER